MLRGMRKIVIHKAGGYEQLKLEEHPDLLPAPGERLVEVRAAGVNYADVCVRWGVYSSAKEYVGWPITPGFEFAGVSRGEEVFGVTRFGAYASQVCADAELVWKKPSSLSFEEAAALPAVYLTAYHGLNQSVPLRRGMKVLIHSAAGGVGSALVQMARIQGLEVTGVVGSSHKVAYLKELGCDHAIDKSSEDLWSRAREFGPYDLVYDANGPETLKQSYAALRPTGKLVSYGFHTMLPKQGGRLNYLKAGLGLLRMPRFNPLNMTNENKSVICFNLSFLFDRKDLLEEGIAQILTWLEDGKLRPPKVQTFALANAADAHRAIESGKTTGKLVLLP
jgi:synaptic vesicle membrane protein VAT-1